MRHRTKFCADRSNRCGDMAVFSFSRWRPSAILDFQKFVILTARTLRGPECVTMPNFVQIGQGVAEISPFSIFFKMAAVHHLGFVICVFGPPTKCILVVSVTVQNLV